MKILEFCKDNGIKVVYEYNEPKKAEVSDTKIRFNGFGNEGHETFGLTKEKPGSEAEFFDFCKTARKPYDLAVGLVLLTAKNSAPNSIKVSSDGDWDSDWKEIRDAYKKIFESYPECPFDESLV